MKIKHAIKRLSQVAFFALCGLLCSRAGRAQTIYTLAMTAALHTPVHLRVGRTTMGETMTALSQQTGQTIECADYLREHRLTLQIEDASALDVLNQLADLTHCKWTEAGAKHVLLSRARPVLPEHPLQISTALREIMPADLLRYIGVAMPDDLWLTREQLAANKTNNRWRVSAQIHKHAAAARDNMETTTWAATLNTLKMGAKYAYAAWTPLERQAAVLTLFSDSIETLNAPGMVGAMNDQYDAYVRDPMLTVIQFKRDRNNHDTVNRYLGADMLELGAHTVTKDGYRYQAFGVNLKLLTDPPFKKPIPLDNGG